MKPPAPRGTSRSRILAASQAMLDLPMPVKVSQIRTLFCPPCGTHKAHHPVAGTTLFRCVSCGRERGDNK